MNENSYTHIIDAIATKSYVVIEDALEDFLSDALIAFAKESSAYKNAGISSSAELQIDKTKRSDKTLWLEEDFGVQSEYLAFTQGLREAVNCSLYMGLSYYEAHFAMYEAGDFYEKHLDAFRGSKNRVLTTVFYLNDAWERSDGGELCIYDENDKLVEKVLPKKGTLVVFLSDKFPHEVLTAKRTRYSIAGWFRVDKRDS